MITSSTRPGMVYLGLPGICTILVANKMLEAILHSIGGENNTLMSTMPLHYFFTTYLRAHSTVKCSVQHWSGGMGRQASRGSVASSEFHDCIFKSPTTPLSPDLLFSPTRRSESLGDRTNFTLKVESHWSMVIASFMIAFSKMSQTPPISIHAISCP